MGCLFTKHTSRTVVAALTDPDEYYLKFNLMSYQRPFNAVGIRDNDIVQLHWVFREIDEDDSKTLSIKEFFTYFALQFISPMGKRVFSLFDADNSGDLDFGEFAICCWNYCSLTDIRLLKFTFDLYDMDDNKVMDVIELEFMMKEAYGSKKRMTQHVIQTLDSYIRKNQQEDINWTKESFVTLVHSHRALFWPLFVLRDELRKKVLGDKFWASALKRRERKYDPMRSKNQNSAKLLRRRIQAVQGEVAANQGPKKRHGNFKSKVKAGENWQEMTPQEKQRFAAHQRIEEKTFRKDAKRREEARKKALATVESIGMFGKIDEKIFEDM